MGVAALAAAAFTLLAASATPAPLRTALPRFRVAEDPAWSPDGKRIAFVASRTRGEFYSPLGPLYVMNADGSGLRQLTPNELTASAPSWSKDGRWIAFSHRTQTLTESSRDVFVVRPDGSELHRLVSDAVDPAWGPGGTRIAYSDTNRFRILTASREGKEIRVVADPGPESGGEGSCKSDGFYQPTWSPDGEFVAFSVSAGEGGECGFDVYIGVSRGYGAKTKVLVNDWVGDPHWSPRGGSLALSNYAPSTGLPDRVGIFDLQTRRIRYLRKGWSPKWSPDAKRIAFVRGLLRDHSQIYVMNADGSNAVPLTRP